SAAVPAAGAGTPTSTLSVVPSTTVSPSLTGSPTAFTHRATIPSATDSPIEGSVTATVSGTSQIVSPSPANWRGVEPIVRLGGVPRRVGAREAPKPSGSAVRARGGRAGSLP